METLIMLKQRFVSILLFCFASMAVQAADYPVKQIRLVVPFAAGGNTDIAARLLAQGLSTDLKQPVYVENKAGAGTAVGTEEVARSQADGYTLLFTTVGLAVNPSLYKNLRYDAKRDFSPVAHVVTSSPVILMHPSIPAANLAEFMSYAKAKGPLSYGSAGVGSAMHLHAEQFRIETGLTVTHVPYRGEGPALVDLLAGRTQFHFGSISSASQYIDSGALKALAVVSAKRSPLLPKVPTAIEAGVPGFVTTTWGVILVPMGTPSDVIKILNNSINRVLAVPATFARFIELGFEPLTTSTPASTALFIETETQYWANLIKKLGITAE
jgi:tripartite-type tricarboxylate transporter receptor subunit TctC